MVAEDFRECFMLISGCRPSQGPNGHDTRQSREIILSRSQPQHGPDPSIIQKADKGTLASLENKGEFGTILSSKEGRLVGK